MNNIKAVKECPSSSQVMEQIEFSKRLADKLENYISKLNTMLGPILMPASPSAKPEGKNEELVQLASEMRENNLKIANQIETLESICSRIQL